MDKLDIIYEDDDLLVVDKPSGLVVFPEKIDNEQKAEFLIDIILKYRPALKMVGLAPRYGIIHRLDKETSGLLLIAKNNQSLKLFQEQFQKGTVLKEYIALCSGIFSENSGRIESLIGRSPSDRRKQKAYPLYSSQIKGKGRLAITDYYVLKKMKNYTLIRAIPRTGRKHQIRCQTAQIGHPIVGDTLYQFKNQTTPTGLKRQFLHAERLTIEGTDGIKREFYSPLSADLQIILNNFQKND